jgi:hypothetical protein
MVVRSMLAPSDRAAARLALSVERHRSRRRGNAGRRDALRRAPRGRLGSEGNRLHRNAGRGRTAIASGSETQRRMVCMDVGTSVSTGLGAHLIGSGRVANRFSRSSSHRSRHACARDDLADPPETGSRVVEGAAERALDGSDALQAAAHWYVRGKGRAGGLADAGGDMRCLGGIGAEHRHGNRRTRTTRALRCLMRGLHQLVGRDDRSLVGAGQDHDVVGARGNVERLGARGLRHHEPMRHNGGDRPKRLVVLGLRADRRPTGARAEELELDAVGCHAHEAHGAALARLAIGVLREPEPAHDGQVADEHERAPRRKPSTRQAVEL